MTITPEMLLGALVVFALGLLAFAIVATLWARAAFRFGRDFKHFSAKREKAGIVVEATFTERADNRSYGFFGQLGDWLSGKSGRKTSFDDAVSIVHPGARERGK